LLTNFYLDSTIYWERADKLYGLVKTLELRNSRGPSLRPKYGIQVHPLLGAVYFTRNYKSTDPRDKIFGILSFLAEPYRDLLPPDYSQTVARVHTKYTAATLLVGKECHLYELFSAGNSPNEALPSWAIDFSDQSLNGVDDPRFLSFPPGGRNVKASKGRPLQCIPIGPRLLIRGTVLDTVETIFTIQERKKIDVHHFHAQLSRLHSIVQHASDRILSPDDLAYPFRHLRSKVCFYNVATAGLCKKKSTFEEWFEKWSLSQASKVKEGEESDISTDCSSSATLQDKPGHESEGSSSSSSSSEIDDGDILLTMHSLVGRRLFITRSGFFGIAVSGIQQGDLIAILFRLGIPYVLRDHGDYHSFVGGSRIGGVMKGELMEFVDKDILREKTFVIR
jgi:hypothetical protein